MNMRAFPKDENAWANYLHRHNSLQQIFPKLTANDLDLWLREMTKKLNDRKIVMSRAVTHVFGPLYKQFSTGKQLINVSPVFIFSYRHIGP